MNTPRNTTLYSIPGTNTFRLASKQLFKNWPTQCGSTLQNLEKSLRKIYIPDDGKIFVQVDQSGAEALIVAYCCRPGRYRDLFIHGIKPHVFVAIHMFHKELKKKSPELSGVIDKALNTEIRDLKSIEGWKALDKLIKSSDNWPAQERYYYLAKQTCHSANYSIKARTFILNVLEKSGGAIVLTRRQGEDFLAIYRNLFREIVEWWYRVQAEIRKNGCLRNLFNFPRAVTSYVREEDFKEWYAFIGQSTVGSITNIAVTNFQNYIEDQNKRWDILANTHDSYMAQCPIGEESECAKIMKQFIEIKMKSPFDGVEFQMRSEAQAGFNWMPCHPEKNPDGLKEIL